jgi:hypothetical protein
MITLLAICSIHFLPPMVVKRTGKTKKLLLEVKQNENLR